MLFSHFLSKEVWGMREKSRARRKAWETQMRHSPQVQRDSRPEQGASHWIPTACAPCRLAEGVWGQVFPGLEMDSQWRTMDSGPRRHWRPSQLAVSHAQPWEKQASTLVRMVGGPLTKFRTYWARKTLKNSQVKSKAVEPLWMSPWITRGTSSFCFLLSVFSEFFVREGEGVVVPSHCAGESDRKESSPPWRCPLVLTLWS